VEVGSENGTRGAEREKPEEATCTIDRGEEEEDGLAGIATSEAAAFVNP